MSSPCLPAALEALTHGGCMERASFLQSSQPIASLPVYVAHASRLRRRRRFVKAQLRALGAPDVTMVLCADAEEVSRLSVTQRRCLHPEYARTRWSPASGMLSNGTLSLALKHRLAHWDMHRRRLPAALVVEDDAHLTPDLWQQLAQYRAPVDADLFFLGSYSQNPSPRMTLSTASTVAGSSPAVHCRAAGDGEPYILGTVAYVVFARGAAALQRPVVAEADVDLSLLSTSRPHCIAGVHSSRTAAVRCAVAAPPRQCGPSHWLVWPSAAAGEENTHASGGQGVRDKWRQHCKELLAAKKPANRNCARFDFASQALRKLDG